MDNPFQLAFIQRLKLMIPSNISMADELMEVLQISQDSAYRRIRGETAMSIDEAIILCNHYKIPIAYFTEEIPGLVNFKYLPPEPKREAFMRHIQTLERAADILLDHDERKIIYAAIDAPLFYHFGFEPLAIFKMHFWMNVIMGIPDFKAYYDENDVDRELLAVTKKIHDDYLVIPSEEIWPEDIMNTTLKQIEYYYDAEYFKKKESAINILDQLHQLVNHLEMMATLSRKLKPGDKTHQQYETFQLYHSDVLLGNNTVLTIADGKRTSFISHMTFNALTTGSEQYADHTEAWLRRIMAKSTLISGTAEKSRMRFFRNLRKSIDTTIEKIKKD